MQSLVFYYQGCRLRRNAPQRDAKGFLANFRECKNTAINEAPMC